MAKSPITCHVLDSTLGKPASGVSVALASLSGSTAATLATGETDADGRCTTLLSPGTALSAGVYRMTFYTEAYFKSLDVPTFYPLVEITFNYTDPSQHYHIPLLLSPFSFTTYRGS